MIDKEQLKKMIKNCEENIKNLTIQLNELKGIARENGIAEEASGFSHPEMSSEVSKKRQEMFDSMKKIREEAQSAAKKAMDEAMSNISSSSKSMNNFSNEGISPFMPNGPTLSNPISPSDIFKERMEKNTKENSGEKIQDIIKRIEEKNKNKVGNPTPEVVEPTPEVVEEPTPEVEEEKP